MERSSKWGVKTFLVHQADDSLQCDFDKVEPAERNSALCRLIYIFYRCYCCCFNMSDNNSDNNSNNMIFAWALGPFESHHWWFEGCLYV